MRDILVRTFFNRNQGKLVYTYQGSSLGEKKFYMEVMKEMKLE